MPFRLFNLISWVITINESRLVSIFIILAIIRTVDRHIYQPPPPSARLPNNPLTLSAVSVELKNQLLEKTEASRDSHRLCNGNHRIDPKASFIQISILTKKTQTWSVASLSWAPHSLSTRGYRYFRLSKPHHNAVPLGGCLLPPRHSEFQITKTTNNCDK